MKNILFVVVDEKLDNLHKKVKTLEEMNTKVDTKLDEILTELKKKRNSGGQSAQVSLVHIMFPL